MKTYKFLPGALATVVACAIALASCGAQAQADVAAGDDVVAKLGGTEVRISEVRQLLEAQPKEVREQLLASAQALDRLVRTELFRRALLTEARTKGWDKRSEVITQMERAREQVVLSSYIGELTRPPADYPSEQEISTVYNANHAEFTVPKSFRISQIFVAVAKDATKADADRLRKKAEDIAKRALAADAEFAKLAQANSDHKPSAVQGGDLGWLTEQEMIPEMSALIPRMSKGEISKVVKTEQGWHIIKLVDLRPPSVRPLADVRGQVVQALRQARAQDLERKYLDDLVAKTPLAVNEIALGRLRTSTRP